jgi:hypothetical protein
MNATQFFKSSTDGSYKSFVVSQVEDMEFDELKVVDVGNKDSEAFRMNLAKYSNHSGKKFKTKIVDGKLYVGRIE